MWLGRKIFRDGEKRRAPRTRDEAIAAQYDEADAKQAPMSSELNARLLKALLEDLPVTAKRALEKGASPELPWRGIYNDDRDRGLPLLAWAVRNNKENYAAMLLQHGADPNRELGWDWTSLLSFAVHHGNSRMVRLLLDHGVPPDQHGRTQNWQEWPYEWAKKHYYTDIVKMLQEEPARRKQAAEEAAAKKQVEADAAARAQREAERAETAAEVTKRITVGKPLVLKGAAPQKPAKKKWLGLG
jgi:ankyrin repeat protein